MIDTGRLVLAFFAPLDPFRAMRSRIFTLLWRSRRAGISGELVFLESWYLRGSVFVVLYAFAGGPFFSTSLLLFLSFGAFWDTFFLPSVFSG